MVYYVTCSISEYCKTQKDNKYDERSSRWKPSGKVRLLGVKKNLLNLLLYLGLISLTISK